MDRPGLHEFLKYNLLATVLICLSLKKEDKKVKCFSKFKVILHNLIHILSYNYYIDFTYKIIYD